MNPPGNAPFTWVVLVPAVLLLAFAAGYVLRVPRMRRRPAGPLVSNFGLPDARLPDGEHFDWDDLCVCPCAECRRGAVCICDECACDPDDPGAPAHSACARSDG